MYYPLLWQWKLKWLMDYMYNSLRLEQWLKYFHENCTYNWAAARQNQQNDLHPVKTQISLCIHAVWSVFAMRSMGS